MRQHILIKDFSVINKGVEEVRIISTVALRVVKGDGKGTQCQGV
jgi:hypothetical protein